MQFQSEHPEPTEDGGYLPLEQLADQPSAAGGLAGQRAAGGSTRRTRSGTRSRRRGALYRAMLSFAVGAGIAAWIPFSFTFLGSSPAPAPALVTASNAGQHPVVVTRTSTGQVVQSPSTASQIASAPAGSTPTLIATRSS